MKTLTFDELAAVSGGASCMAAAKQQAIKFSAQENHVDPKTIRATSASFVSQERGVRYYGVGLDNRDVLNVGVRGKDCRPAGINYVGDGA
jgi:bacteriocin-like protein